jgi:hypothetical protein
LPSIPRLPWTVQGLHSMPISAKNYEKPAKDGRGIICESLKVGPYRSLKTQGFEQRFNDQVGVFPQEPVAASLCTFRASLWLTCL